jgi:hypothetical protein
VLLPVGSNFWRVSGEGEEENTIGLVPDLATSTCKILSELVMVRTWAMDR